MAMRLSAQLIENQLILSVTGASFPAGVASALDYSLYPLH